MGPFLAPLPSPFVQAEDRRPCTEAGTRHLEPGTSSLLSCILYLASCIVYVYF